MGSVSKKSKTKRQADRQPMSDNDLLRLLADKRGHSERNMAEQFSVTPPAIYARLVRLVLAQAVTRKREDIAFGQGMLQYLYCITDRGLKTLAQAEMNELFCNNRSRGLFGASDVFARLPLPPDRCPCYPG